MSRICTRCAGDPQSDEQFSEYGQICRTCKLKSAADSLAHSKAYKRNWFKENSEAWNEYQRKLHAETAAVRKLKRLRRLFEMDVPKGKTSDRMYEVMWSAYQVGYNRRDGRK